MLDASIPEDSKSDGESYRPETTDGADQGNSEEPTDKERGLEVSPDVAPGPQEGLAVDSTVWTVHDLTVGEIMYCPDIYIGASGMFKPKDDITALESVRIAQLFTLVQSAAKASYMYDADRFIKEHKLERHFEP